MKRSANSAGEVAGGLLRFGVVALADVERIHELSLRVLAETGILLHYPPARQLLADHGAARGRSAAGGPHPAPSGGAGVGLGTARSARVQPG